MRKVYHSKENSLGLPVAVGVAASLTAVIFCIIPFSHLVNKPGHTLELRKASVADLPPPKEEEQQAPPPEEERKPDAPAEPQLADIPQQIPIAADLDVAAGAGGALAGFGEGRAMAAAQTVQDETFDFSELEKKPESLPQYQARPQYPKELSKAKIEGLVTLVFIVDENGRVEDPRVESSSRPEFEKPALEAVRKWRFRPGQKNGQSVRAYLKIPIRFRVASS